MSNPAYTCCRLEFWSSKVCKANGTEGWIWDPMDHFDGVLRSDRVLMDQRLKSTTRVEGSVSPVVKLYAPPWQE